MCHPTFRLSGPSISNRSCFLFAALLIHVEGKPTLGGWRTIDAGTESKLVRLRTPADRAIDPGARFYLVTHGMNGVCLGDRFHTLAETISAFLPQANVVMVDWSDAARSRWLGLNLPFVVALKVDAVGDEASEMLCNLGFDAANATLIGESFGNYVNAKIASNFGHVDRMLAMNPASEVGGYPIPDLRQCSRRSYSFHTYSFFDTRVSLAHTSVFLETPPEATGIEQHTAGIARLTATIGEGSGGWLDANFVAADESREHFKVRATLDGRLLEANLPRHRSVTDEVERESRASAPETEGTVAGDAEADQAQLISPEFLAGAGLAAR
jgi:hypothetical protein